MSVVTMLFHTVLDKSAMQIGKKIKSYKYRKKIQIVNFIKTQETI